MIKFLIMEDDDSLRFILKKILTKNFSCTVYEARDGKKGLDILQNEIPDLILLDVNMPIMDGKETIEIINSHSTLKKIPVIIVTALSDKETVGTFVKKGVVDYLLKPLDPIESVKRINRALQMNNIDAAPPSSDNEKTEPISTPRLLLVDNNKESIDEFNSLFYDRFSIITSKNGIETIDLFNSYHPRYIVVSEKIGLLDKKIILQKIREIVDYTQTSIFLLVDDKLSQSAKIFNFDGVIVKSKEDTVFKNDLVRIILKEEAEAPISESSDTRTQDGI